MIITAPHIRACGRYCSRPHRRAIRATARTTGARAEGIIRALTGQPEAAVWFFPGATQANFIVISAALSPVESVICAETGHIQCHEAASVEHVGHKLLALPATDGKITAEQIAECAAA